MTSASERDQQHMLMQAARQLAEAGVSSPRSDAEWLLCHVMGIARGALMSARPDDGQRAEFERLVSQRAQRIPLQHLTGTVSFRFCELAIGPGAFVPRPESEVLAGWVIECASSLSDPVVVDLCTGAGAIARSIAEEVPHASVYAVELDESALAWAERNLAGTGVELRHGDIHDALAELDANVDIVVANPPYIPLEAWESVQIEVRDHDPALALWSGFDGLDAVRGVEQAGYRLLRGGGALAVEHADVQAESAPAVFADASRWHTVRDRQDLAGQPRYVTAIRQRRIR